jgi:serine/threonine protein kinase
VFSLGGTLLFAATGHPPYHGETTADVLVQLATEPPDLAGLPAELDALVRPCLDRIPVRRPSSAALLARLGEFAEPGSYLPEAALALIREHQRDPVPAARVRTSARSANDDDVDETDDDERTANSYPGLPASARPEVPDSSLRAWRHRLPAWAGWAAVGAVLVTVGAILGATLSDSDNSASNSSPGTVVSNGRPPPASLGPLCAAGQSGAGPALCVNADEGTSTTTFTVHAHGFGAGRDVPLTELFYPPPQGALPPAPQRLRTITMPANGQIQLKPPFQLGLYDIVAPGGIGVVFRIDPLGGGPP